MGSCNTLNDLSNKVCVPNKTAGLNLSVFNMITGINDSKILTKHKSCECKCKLEGSKCISNQKRNNDKCWCDCKNPEEHNACEKDYILNLDHVVVIELNNYQVKMTIQWLWVMKLQMLQIVCQQMCIQILRILCW